ncbi:MAG TPA: ABC transporter permease [Planctomycetota bacterium]|nr:ABC transporter permease [Planctomycetota bacterium]
MRRALVLARRELRAYFDSPIAYIFLVVFLALSSYFFFFQIQGFFFVGQATMRIYFEILPYLLLLVVPALTMRLWAEERRAGTEELLLTFPLRPLEVVAGKFLAAFALVALTLLLSLPLAFTVASLGPLDWGPVVGGLLGGALLGASYLAFGMFVSSLTRNQIVAFILTLVGLLVLVTVGSTLVLARAPSALAPFLEAVDLESHFKAIARGVPDLRDLFFYLSFIGFFLYLNAAALAWRRWR